MKSSRLQPAYQREHNARVHVFDAGALPWQDTAHSGLKLKPIRNDDQRGEFLGLVYFGAFARSGLHQHRGVATSFVLDGGLTDFHGSLRQNQVGINVCGSTHDAVSYQTTVLAARLEGPVLYPPNDAEPSGVHAGSRTEAFVNPGPDQVPDHNVTVDELPTQATGLPGVLRQMVFDYMGTGHTRRMLQLQLRPTTMLPLCLATDWIEFWVRGGEIEINGQRAWANCFVIAEPGATLELRAPFGARLIVWAEGRERWPDGNAANLLGF